MTIRYPRAGERFSIWPARGHCIVCQQPATLEIDMQISMFRGDDIPVKVCKEHSKTAPDKLVELELQRLEAARRASQRKRI